MKCASLFCFAVAAMVAPAFAQGIPPVLDVTKQPYLSIVTVDDTGTVAVKRGRYLGKAEVAAEAPVEGMLSARILVRATYTGPESLVDGWCYGTETCPLDVTKRPFVTILVTEGSVKSVRGRYLGVAADLMDEAPVEGMVPVTILTQEDHRPDPMQPAVKRDVLKKGWAYGPKMCTR